MKHHVDIVKNEMAAGRQVRVGCVRAGQGGLDVERFDDGQCWEETVWTRDIVDPDKGTRVDPHDDPERYVELLHTAMNHPFLFASEVHGADECPFSQGQEVRGEPRTGSTV